MSKVAKTSNIFDKSIKMGDDYLKSRRPLLGATMMDLWWIVVKVADDRHSPYSILNILNFLSG